MRAPPAAKRASAACSVDAQQRNRPIAGAGAQLAHVLAVELDRRARGRHCALHAHRKQALPDQEGAVLQVRAAQLSWPSSATLLPVDSVQLVETTLQQQRLLELQIPAAVRPAPEAQPQRLRSPRMALRGYRAPPARAPPFLLAPARARQVWQASDRRKPPRHRPAEFSPHPDRRRRRLPSPRCDPQPSRWSAA